MTDCLVHNIETSVDSLIPDTLQAWRANFDLLKWRMSGNLYYLVDQKQESNYLEKWEQCRTSAWFARHKLSGEVRVFSSACRLRWCSLCADARRGFITHTVADWLKQARYPKFLTLTLKHTNAPLAHQVKSLYEYFRKFRHAKFVRESCYGGIWFFQIKRSSRSGQWHPHIHCVIEGKYMKQRLLSELWCRVTYGSTIVDIRPIRDVGRAAAEVARYASTPADLPGIAKCDYVELFEALHKRKSCGTWGSARKVSLRQPRAKEVNEWINVGSWTVMYASQNREPAARIIIESWLKGEPLAEGITMSFDYSELVNRSIDDILERPPPFLPGFYN